MLRRALEQQPGNSDLKHALAQDLLYSDQIDDALKVYQDLSRRGSEGRSSAAANFEDLSTKEGFREGA